MKKPNGVYLIILLIFFVLAFNAYGAFLLITDPSGDSAGLGLGKLYELTTLKKYTFFGILLFILGVLFPLFTNLCLITPPPFKWPKKLNIYDKYVWSYSYALYTSYIFIFIAAINLLLREGSSIFPSLMVIISGVLIIILNSPEVQKFFTRKSKKTKTSSLAT